MSDLPENLADLQAELVALHGTLSAAGADVGSATIGQTTSAAWNLNGRPVGPRAGSWDDGKAELFYERGDRTFRITLEEVPF